jgi:2-polyprenyl-3-methyl-5-hydroxy-6-metoxy-1,4-benzoquinol methylase
VIYSFFYRPIQNLIKIFLIKKNFKSQLSNYLNNNTYDEIHDIGCSDGLLAKNINLKNSKYFGYDIDSINIKLAKKNFKNNKNINFYNKSIENLSYENNKKKIFILVGVFHHLNDKQILSFLSKLSPKDHVISIDPFFHKKMNAFGLLMKKLDRGKFIRSLSGYKKILKNFHFSERISHYLRFYSHLISCKNIESSKIKIFFD